MFCCLIGPYNYEETSRRYHAYQLILCTGVAAASIRLRLCTTGRLFQSQDTALLSDRNVGPVPPEIMLGCFVVTGLIVSVVYSIDWSSLF
jgi:hypothetical protein